MGVLVCPALGTPAGRLLADVYPLGGHGGGRPSKVRSPYGEEGSSSSL